MFRGQVETRNTGGSSKCTVPGWSVSWPWRGPRFCLFRCVDNAREEVAVKDKKKGKVWNEDLGKSPYAKVKGQSSCSPCSPTGSCAGGRNGDGPLEEGGGHRSWPLTTD